jgi:heme/copper-type cytochrome/quinol oxidase subunit 2
MKGIVIRALVPTLSAFSVALALCLAQLIPVVAEDQKVQVVEITAKKYEYSNSPVHVKSGAKVHLKITATDHDHGFKISPVPDGALPNGADGLIFSSAQECWQLKKGETTIIEFLAQTPGTYTFKCCHTCGLGHRGMKGQIVVEE